MQNVIIKDPLLLLNRTQPPLVHMFMDIALRGCACTVYMCNDLIHVHVPVHVCSSVVWVQEVTKLHHNAVWVYALLFLNIIIHVHVGIPVVGGREE